MKRKLFCFVSLMFVFLTVKGQQEPNVLRYYMKNGTTFDVKITELDRLQKVNNIGMNNVYNNGKQPKSILFSQVDSIVFLYVELPSGNNVNRNTNPDAMRLEFPHLKSGSDQLLVTHSTKEYGVTFSLEWDCSKRSQRWTCYQFHDGIPDNNVGRTGTWKDDPNIPKAYQTHSSEYSGTGYSRGHMCMSDDRQSSTEQNAQTFYISNAHPQYQNHNGFLWLSLENKVNGWGNNSSFRDTLYVVKAGTIDKPEQLLAPTNTGLLVPKYMYMAVLCYKGGNYKAIAFWTEHSNQKITNANLSQYAISVRELEERTGIDFFCNLPDDTEAQVEAELKLADWSL